MAKSKYAPALFEVISQKDEKPSGKVPLPKWWQSKGAATSSAESTPAQPADKPAQSTPAAGQPMQEAPTAPETNRSAAEVANASPAPAAANAPIAAKINSVAPQPAAVPVRSSRDQGGAAWDDEFPPAVRLRNGRVELSLNPTNTAIVVGALLLTLFLAYQMGRGVSSTARLDAQALEQKDSLDEIRNGPADKEVLDVKTARGSTPKPSGRSPLAGLSTSAGQVVPKPRVNTPPAAAPNPATTGKPSATVVLPDSVRRTPGLTYVVLEGNIRREHKPEAEQIRQWLKRTYNVDTTLELSGDRYEIVSTQGYDYNNDAEKRKAEEFREIVKGWGNEYKKAFGVQANYLMKSPGLKKQK